ncbi:bromodomain testis-specific protein [Drosophila montana]|uniref:bromodomain testis-specific protein n=1 Tax=Drosophila montana TaxID=40370 RepID=UPI00313C99CB
MDVEGAQRKQKTSPRNEPYVHPVNGIVQPPVMPPPGRRGRRTNVLESLKSVLKYVWKSRWSYYFRYPVDAVALCIPDYHNLIKHPMDLSTIRRRLNNNYYWKSDEALGDFELIFENCMLYNLEGSEVHKAGKELREAFYTRLSYIDMSNETELIPQAVLRKRKAESMMQMNPIYESVTPATPKLPKQSTETIWSPAEPEIYTEPELYSEPIKFEVNPTTLFEWQNYLVEKSHSEQLLRAMTKRKRNLVNWPFKCCDLWREYAQNLHYDHDAEEKLDWDILRNRLENNQFDSFEEFVDKLRVMFQNALTCFPVDETLIEAVNEINDILESRLEDFKNSIAEMKQRVRQLVTKKLQTYNAIIAQQTSLINSEENFSYAHECCE